jgi:hypothetical protein
MFSHPDSASLGDYIPDLGKKEDCFYKLAQKDL